jgi:hypothetical protein
MTPPLVKYLRQAPSGGIGVATDRQEQLDAPPSSSRNDHAAVA